MTYRKAKCIELHDAGVAFAEHEDDYTLTYLPGRGEYATRPAFKIPLVDIMKAATALYLDIDKDGFTHLDGQTNQTMTDLIQRGNERQSVVRYKDYEINIYRRYEDIGGETTDFEIALLEAEIQAANLINIKIGLIWSGHEGLDISEMSYSGAFTVWWSE